MRFFFMSHELQQVAIFRSLQPRYPLSTRPLRVERSKIAFAGSSVYDTSNNYASRMPTHLGFKKLLSRPAFILAAWSGSTFRLRTRNA